MKVWTEIEDWSRELRLMLGTVRNILRACMTEDLKKEEDDGKH